MNILTYFLLKCLLFPFERDLVMSQSKSTPPLSRYQLIIFDWDGTLMDSASRIISCLQQASLKADLPLQSEHDYRRYIGLSLQEVLKRLHPEATQWQLTVMDAVYRWQFMEANHTDMRLFLGAESVLDKLKQSGKKLAIATGKSRQGLNLVLAETGLAHYFDVTKSAEETRSKPDPQMLQDILTELHIPVSQALMIGDAVFDLEMAQNIGMDALALTHGVHDRAELAPYHPIAFCDDLIQLSDWLYQQ
jgi:phosphoglycolate phosphatase